jgi:radical SAM superfamily enzyme YgiQ (UPF0313 family)/Tfp pilus assembly protein PilF
MVIGLYSLAALIMERGYEVQFMNLALLPWSEALRRVQAETPDVAGVSCMTQSRKPALSLAQDLKRILPRSTVVMGGVHPTFLHREIIRRCPWVDFVVVGEAERSFPELLEKLAAGGDGTDVPGVIARDEAGNPVWPGPADCVEDLGSLPVPAKYFRYEVVATSRGCPFHCSFCGSRAFWGKRVRERPVEHVLEEVELLKRFHRVPVISFKDETFTAKASRVRAICEGIIARGLDLWWRCDTRVDCVDEERLYWMRRAGCIQISFGVESGSEAMLKRMNKKISLERVREATRLARKFGILVRHYMIAGAPGETEEDLRASIRLIQEARPNFMIASPMIVYPGTDDYAAYCQERGKDDSIWFDLDQANVGYDTNEKWRNTAAGREFLGWVNSGVEYREAPVHFPFTEEELRESAERLSDCFLNQYELANHLRKAGRHEEALVYFERAKALRPESCACRVNMGVSFMNLNRLDEATAEWEAVEGLAGASDDSLLRAWLFRGMIAEARDQADEALALWSRAHARFPEARDPLQEAARLCARLGRWPEAEEWAAKWRGLDPESSEAWHILALAAMALNAPGDAQVFFESALRLSPKNGEIYCNYAVLMLRAGQTADADKLLRLCLKRAPEHPRAKQLLDAMSPTNKGDAH